MFAEKLIIDVYIFVVQQNKTITKNKTKQKNSNNNKNLSSTKKISLKEDESFENKP